MMTVGQSRSSHTKFARLIRYFTSLQEKLYSLASIEGWNLVCSDDVFNLLFKGRHPPFPLVLWWLIRKSLCMLAHMVTNVIILVPVSLPVVCIGSN